MKVTSAGERTSYSYGHKGALLYIKIDHKGAFVEIKNLPEYLGSPNNLIPASLSYLLRFECQLAKQLQDIGLDVGPIRELAISRIDINLNILTDHPFRDYIPILESVGPTRMTRDRFATSYTLKNTLRAVCFYDKGEHLRKRKRYETGPENIMRGEIKLWRKREVEKNGLSTFGSLIENRDTLAEIYSAHMKTILGESLAETGGGLSSGLLLLVRVDRTRAQKMSFAADMYRTIGREALREELAKKHSPDYVGKMIRENDLLYRERLALESSSESTYRALLEELQQKFFMLSLSGTEHDPVHGVALPESSVR